MMPPENQETLWDQVDAICDVYEEQLRGGEPQAIGDAVPGEASETFTEILLYELLVLEQAYQGLPAAETAGRAYASKFPDASEWVERCLRRLSQRSVDSTKAEPGTLAERSPATGDPLTTHAGQPVRNLADYELLEEIRRGGMGVVYRARHRRLGRVVALKAILAGEFASPHARKRFQAETRAAAQLDHPGIVPIYEVGESEGRPFCAMRLVSGSDLEEKVKESLYRPFAAARLLQALAEAVGYAHAQGILHRDLKPANVLIDEEGHPQLTDFGLAKDLNLEPARGLTRSGQVLGTPTYMAPEQAAGQLDRIGHETDVYSLGAILYFVLTGRPPLRAPTVSETLLQVITREPISPRALNPQIDHDLETICLKCLAKEPQHRYHSCTALAADLARFLEGRPITARPVSAVGRATRWCRRNPTRFALLATTSLLLIAIMVGVMYRRQSVLSSRALQVAQALATSRQETAATAQFYRLLQEAKSLAARREPGWTWEVERLLTEAVELPSAVRDHDLLRGTLTEMLTHFDFRFRQTVAKGTLAGSLAFSPDGKYFALGDSIDETRPTIQVFSVTHLDSPQWTFAFHSEADTQRRIARGDAKVDNGIRALGFSPDGRWLAAGTRFGKVLVYDLQAPQAAPKRLEVLADQEVSKVGFSHDGRLLFALVSEQRLVQWEHFQQPVIIDADVRDFACNSRGDDLVVLYRDKIEVRASLDQSPEQMHNRIGEAIKDGGRCALAPDGRMLAVEYEDAISIFDMRTGWRVPRLLRDGGLQTAMAHRGLAFDGDRVIASGNETLRVWDPASGNLLYRLPASSRHIPIMALDPLGRFLAVRKGGPTEFYELRRPPHRRSMGGIMDRTRQAAIEDGVLVAAREAAWPSHRVRMMQWDCQTGRDLSEFLICDSSGADYPNAGSEAAAWGNRRAVTAYPLGLVVWENPPDKPLRVQTLNEIGKSVSLPLETLRDEQNQSVPPFPLAGGEPVLRIRPTQEPVVFRVQVPTESLPPQWTRLAVSVVVRWQRNQNGGDAIIGGYVDRPSVANAPPWTGDRRRWGIREFAGADAALVVLQRAERQRFTDDWDARLELPGADAPFDYVDIQQILVSPLPADEAGQAEDPALIDRITFAPDGQRLWGVISDEYLASWGLEDPGPPRRWTSRPEGLTHLYDIQIGQDRVYSAGRNGHVQLTDRGAGQWVTQLPVSSEPVGQIDLGPGEAWMIVSGDAGQVEKRGLPAGERLETIRAGREPVTAQALSPDAKWLALGDASGLCTLYRREATGFQRYVELGRYARPLNQLIFSRDGRYLAVISQHRLASDVFDLAGLQQAFAAYEADQ